MRRSSFARFGLRIVFERGVFACTSMLWGICGEFVCIRDWIYMAEVAKGML